MDETPPFQSVPFDEKLGAETDGGLAVPAGILCPRCKEFQIVYNGNYFCSDFEDCGWAFDSDSQHPYIKRLGELLYARYQEYQRHTESKKRYARSRKPRKRKGRNT